MKKLLALLLIFVSLFAFAGCELDEDTALQLTGDVLTLLLEDGVSYPDTEPLPFDPDEEDYAAYVTEDGWYDDVDTVAAYLITYDELLDNYLTKREAQSLGWVQQEGNLWDVAEGMSIGGDYFGNYEGLLPDGEYRECDIDYDGGSRGAERLVFTVEGDLYIYYTDDHYESFELIYAEE